MVSSVQQTSDSLPLVQINRMMELYDEAKSTVAEICKIYGISRPSFYNYLKNRKAENAAKELAIARLRPELS